MNWVLGVAGQPRRLRGLEQFRVYWEKSRAVKTTNLDGLFNSSKALIETIG